MGADESKLLPEFEEQGSGPNYISFFVNGKEYNVRKDGLDPEFGPNYFLAQYLREKLGLTGTKLSCHEGGCGTCTVTIKSTHPSSGQQITRSANACILPLYACDGFDITTIEGIGNAKTGYHEIQNRLVKFGGVQCGFCSPGFVMNMYSYAQVNPRFTGGNVEYSLDGNVCRCTAYRPIVDAFKSLSSNASQELLRKCQDIEDCYKYPALVAKHGDHDSGDEGKVSIEIVSPPRNFYIRNTTSSSSSGEEWIKVTSLSTLFELLQKLKYVQKRYRLVAGNTGIGVYKNDGPYSSYIDINDVPELHKFSMDKSGMVFGGGSTFTTVIDQCTAAAKIDGFVYAARFSRHFRRTASLTVRNLATIGGSLALQRDHPDFPNDLFVLFDSIGATVRIGSSPTLYQSYTLSEFLELDMSGKVILSVHLPTFGSNHIFRSFKVSRRYQNSIAHVNAAFLCQVDRNNKFKILSKPSLCFGGISPKFSHARATEEYLVGKELNAKSCRECLETLEREIEPNASPPAPSPAYRRGLAVSYLYKFILGIRGDSVTPALKSGALDVERGLNSGTQAYDSDKSKWPLYQPIPKLESFPLASGEAEFIDDIPPRRNELFGQFVLTTVANATIANVDASHALLVPGVVAFITAKDIPGANNHAVFGVYKEEIFVSNKVLYAGQPVGLVVAENRSAALEARNKVVIKYANIAKPTVDIKESVKLQTTESNSKKVWANFAFPDKGTSSTKAEQIMSNMKNAQSVRKSKKGASLQENLHTVKGEFITRSQYHFHLETQSCLCIPKQEGGGGGGGGLDVYSSTQQLDNVQASIASCLKIPNNSINMHLSRIGGGFGGKALKANHVATACAVAAYATNKPVRVVLDLETNMKMIGKRLPYLTKYEATVDDTGKIHDLTADIYCDCGAVANNPSSLFATISFQSCYRATQWDLTPGVATTDTHPNTFCRSPGGAQGVAAVETLMEHIAFAVKKDPLEVRQVNFIHQGDPLVGIPGAKLKTTNPLPAMIEELKRSSDYVSRKSFVESHNKTNRWRKRGLSLVPQRFPIYYSDFRLPTFISVYHADGTVSVAHGGIETGEGINTKVAQVVAHTLGIPIDQVKIKPNNNLVSPNAALSAASVTSELVCHSAQQACLKLLEKMAPVREKLANPSWQQLVTACNTKGMLLTSQYQDVPGEGETIISYDVWGAAVAEIEVDVLTGDYRIIRVDILEDAGNSLNPMLDIGQIEGAFVFGLGWLLTENLVFDKDTGELLTCNTWTYKPMLSADIPEDLRVTLLKNSPNPYGVLSSKATEEAPLHLSTSVVFALRNAIDSARKDVGNNDWYQMDAPVSREDIRRLALTSTEQFLL